MFSFLSDLTARAALPLGLLFLAGYNVFVLNRLHRQWMLLDLMGMFAVLQLWVAPALRYLLESWGWTLDPNNDMAVPATVYFPTVIPMVLALVAGVRMGNGECGMRNAEWGVRNAEWWLLFGLGLGALVALPWMQGGFRQPLVLLKGLLWVAAAYGMVTALLFSREGSARVRGWLQTGLPVVLLGWDAMLSGFFGSWVLGCLFLAMVYCSCRKVPWTRILLVQVVSVVLVAYLMSFKHQYRLSVLEHKAQGMDRAPLFFKAAVQALEPPYGWAQFDPVLERVNQGMHVSHVLAYVPAQAPHGYGKSLAQAFAAAFVPRFLWPTKHRAGGQYNRERFLGVKNATYSYNLGPVGEAWAHFGRWGWVYCFGFAYALAWVQRLLLRASVRWQVPLGLFSFYLFAPALLQDGDSGIVWNHLVKAGLVVGMLVVGRSVLLR